MNELIEELKAKRLAQVSGTKTRRKDASHPHAPHAEKEEDKHVGQIEALKTKSEVYRRLLERYSETLAPFEEKTIPELKALVNPEDESLLRVKGRIFEQMISTKPPDWKYAPANFREFMLRSLEYCKTLKPTNAELSFSYWLSPKEIVDLGAADHFDKAIFLCSLLQSVGGNARVRVIELQGGDKHVIVMLKENGDGNEGGSSKTVLLDPSNENALSEGEEESVLGNYVLEGKPIVRSLYEFNNVDYADFEE